MPTTKLGAGAKAPFSLRCQLRPNQRKIDACSVGYLAPSAKPAYPDELLHRLRLWLGGTTALVLVLGDVGGVHSLASLHLVCAFLQYFHYWLEPNKTSTLLIAITL